MIISNLASRILRPFAAAGSKATIPVNQADATRASYDQGFPALNMTPIAAGGVPPSGQDFNGILYDISNAAMWQQAVGILPWSAEFAQSQVSGGYPKNALVVHNAVLYQSSVDNNTETPGAGTNWRGVGVSNASQPQHAVTLWQMQDALAQHTHPDAKQSASGFMSAANKQKLDGLTFGSSLVSNGYQKLLGGLIIQWGSVGCPANYVANTRFAFNLPIAFPSSALRIILSNSGDNNFTPGTQALSISNSRAEVVWGQSSVPAFGLAASYVAFGF